jgi:hypothetical protein
VIAARTRARLFDLVAVARPVMARRAWPLLAVAIGTIPLAIAYLLGTPAHQPLTGLLVAPLFWACVCDDRLGRAMALVVAVMGSHSALAIYLSAIDPTGAAACLAGSEPYWEQTLHWVRTGDDPEYQWRVWLPRHLLLFGSMLVVGGLTLGIVPFARGVEQLDLMNFYVGRMVVQSDSPATALLFGWHPWSLLRGTAYTVLVFAASSWVLERITGRRISTPARHRWRFALGTGLAIADGLAKLWLAPIVRDQLAGTVGPDAR